MSVRQEADCHFLQTPTQAVERLERTPKMACEIFSPLDCAAHGAIRRSRGAGRPALIKTLTDQNVDRLAQTERLRFELVDRLGPVIFQQSGQRTVGENATIGLTAGAIVTFVFGIADPLNRGPTNRTRLFEFAVDRHFGSKCGDSLRKRLWHRTIQPVSRAIRLDIQG